MKGYFIGLMVISIVLFSSCEKKLEEARIVGKVTSVEKTQTIFGAEVILYSVESNAGETYYAGFREVEMKSNPILVIRWPSLGDSVELVLDEYDFVASIKIPVIKSDLDNKKSIGFEEKIWFGVKEFRILNQP